MALKGAVRVIECVESNGDGQEARILGEFLKMANWRYNICEVYNGSNNKKRSFLKGFLDSHDRFLHISAHGDENGLSFGDEQNTTINPSDIKRYCKNRKPLKKKFVTISACGHISAKFVMELHKFTGVTAVISILAPVNFPESALALELRQVELNDLASGLRNRARKAWKKPSSFALTLAGSAISVLTAPIAATLALASSLIGHGEHGEIDTGAYSYLFRAQSRFDRY